jgi:2'-5' RNA ligase
VPAQRLPDLVEVLQVPREAITLEFGQSEIWPHGTAVLRPLAIPQALARLHSALAPRVSGFGLALDERPYQPHVTLARRAAGAQAPAQSPGIRWQADDGYVLVRSLPDRAGYEVLKRYG